MLDQKLNLFFKPVLTKFAIILLKYEILPNQITLFSFILGIFCFIFLSLGMIYIALIFFILNRFFDGVDGTLARLKKPTDLGGFYDIISDFLIYALLPFGFINLAKVPSTPSKNLFNMKKIKAMYIIPRDKKIKQKIPKMKLNNVI